MKDNFHFLWSWVVAWYQFNFWPLWSLKRMSQNVLELNFYSKFFYLGHFCFVSTLLNLNWFELVWTITKECFELALLDWIRLQSCLFWIISLKRSCMKIRMILQKGFLSIALCKKVSCILVKWTMENDLALWIEWGWAYTSWAEAQWGQQFYEFDFKFVFSTTISWFSV